MATDGSTARRNYGRLHGRVSGERHCAHPGCVGPGEFRAPGARHRRSGFDGPGEYRWLCLDHVREFNARYNFFEGMSSDEIYEAQKPFSGWETETRAFAHAGSPPPRWSDYADPLDAISARFRDKLHPARADGRALSDGNRADLRTLDLGPDADRRALRKRYAELVRRYHPDRNGGDRSHETALREVIGAYSRLKSARAFA